MNARELKERFAQVRSGDKEAFALIYNDMKIPAYTIICKIVGKQEVAEDITHELFLKLYNSPPDSFIKNPRAWMFQVARNLALDDLRKRQHGELDIETSIDQLFI